MKDKDQQLVHVLGKISNALDRMVRDLSPLVEEYKEQTKHLPDVPRGLEDCPDCEGAGVVMYISDETNLWKSRYCACRSV
jgi:hypothetical protein